jgi:hypothetical protein
MGCALWSIKQGEYDQEFLDDAEVSSDALDMVSSLFRPKPDVVYSTSHCCLRVYINGELTVFENAFGEHLSRIDRILS